MSIFFDTAWFQKTMQAHNLTKKELARHLGVSLELLQDIWEDICIATPKQIGIIADLLGEDTHEVARRCGFPTAPPEQRILPEKKLPEQESLEKRLSHIEKKLQDIHNLLLAFIERPR